MRHELSVHRNRSFALTITTRDHLPAEIRDTPAGAMLQLISGFWVSRALYVAAKLGIADRVKDKPKRSKELAQETGTHAPSLYRVLRALASVGVFSEDEKGRFASTPLATTLRSDMPGSLRAFILAELGGEPYSAWGAVLDSVKTGKPTFDQVFGMSAWLYRIQHPEHAPTFEEAMASFSAAANAAVLASYDFSSCKKIVDIGGGDGTLLIFLLQAHPHLQGVLFDLPHVTSDAPRRLEAEGVVERCQVVAGDFFISVPSGGDVYLLKWVIHNWEDEQAIAILKTCRRAMSSQSKLLLIEAIMLKSNIPSFHKFMDLNMLVVTGGRERTAAEYQTLLRLAGFRLTQLMPTSSGMSVIEAVRA